MWCRAHHVVFQLRAVVKAGCCLGCLARFAVLVLSQVIIRRGCTHVPELWSAAAEAAPRVFPFLICEPEAQS